MMIDAAAVLLLVGDCLLRLRRGGLQGNVLFHCCCVRATFTGLCATDSQRSVRHKHAPADWIHHAAA